MSLPEPLDQDHPPLPSSYTTTITTTTTTPPHPPSQSTHPPQEPPASPATKPSLEAQTAFTATLRSVGQNYETQLRERARTLHDNAAVLDQQQTNLQQATAALAKQNVQLGRVADSARSALKEIGDVQNWAEVIEQEILVLEETLRLVEMGDGEDHVDHSKVDGEEHGTGDGNGKVVREEVARDSSDGNEIREDEVPVRRGGWFRWW
ncbi:uncharacterized protein BP01DRAFT_74212 [Aspergillus saccharolyticus JOP 1030-1]|uniref:Biogenesis of lysosome-related organelles complex 1 subunit 1 n=1 Tax=Aspergillus saccharolyticus JOP 1030-1 TaxID=1450539 RepID=A0A319ASJ2_9EURO|nr:hypothetical protein BP01DRAFT_74212 [Aspergillus saccharolyticus JOP 1030-1]PYH49232.1 hypothetical protein BP01DRAFT_74212 [Aspergillus saccharolyticus JOP 1030-1]